MNQQINILGFAGSLRKASYNRALLQSALNLMPESARLDVFDLASIPLFNQDFEHSPPDIVKEFKNRIKAADAILIASPEYNYSIPGVLKNAIDWASRPYGDNAFDGKAVAMMSASIGMLGGARAQYHLRQSFVFLNMHTLNKPEVFVTFAQKKFDDQGKLIDEQTKKLIRDLLDNLINLVRKLKTI